MSLTETRFVNFLLEYSKLQLKNVCFSKKSRRDKPSLHIHVVVIFVFFLIRKYYNTIVVFSQKLKFENCHKQYFLFKLY